MDFFNHFKDIAVQNPFIFMISVFLVSVVPKLFEFLINSKKIDFESKESVYDRLSTRVGSLQNRCELLEKEVDIWRDRYYDLKSELSSLEIENQKLLSELKLLKEEREINLRS